MSASDHRDPAGSLSARLREVSFGGHGGGKNWSGDGPGQQDPRFAKAYMRGGLNREGIAAQAAQHFLMYEALERAAELHHERLGDSFEFWLPELHRLPSLTADLEHWIGSSWQTLVRERYNTAGIAAYVDRLNAVASTSLPLFVAHHYTRYLADLSGGLMIARAFRESYGMEGDTGTRFYTFDEISDPKAYKAAYRERLDNAGFSAAEQAEIAREVALAYDLNNNAAADLERRYKEYAA